MYTVEEVAKKLDHAVLKPTQTDEDVRTNAEMCKKWKVGSLCVRPSDVKLAADILKGSETCVSMVVGFPHGANLPETKALEATRGIEDGAVELDMVMNIGKFMSGDFDAVQKDIEAVVAAAKPHNVLVKVIMETGYLTLDQVAQACKIAEAAGADFVKTSTGFGDGQAEPDVIEVMVKTVGETMGVKASGGVRTWERSTMFLDLGCGRLGVASADAILSGGKAEGSY